jgi:hypothetical protein
MFAVVRVGVAYANDSFLIPEYKLLVAQEVTPEAESAE